MSQKVSVLAVTTEALLNESFRNRRFLKVSSLWTPISGRWGRRSQSIYGPLYREWCSYNFAAGSFHTKKLCSRLFSRKIEFYWHKQRYRVFVLPFGGLRGNVHGSSMARWKARCGLPISANWTFSLAITLEALWADIGRNRCARKGGGKLSAQILGGKGRPHPQILASEN